MHITRIIVRTIVIFILVISIPAAFYFVHRYNVKRGAGFNDLISSITLNPYLVHFNSDSVSSGGNHPYDTVREISKNELIDIVNEVKELSFKNSFIDSPDLLSKSRKCFYSTGEFPKHYLICFSENKIVNYLRTDGPNELYWSIPGFEKINRDILIETIPSLQSCVVDDDCTLESLGVCPPLDNPCESKDVSCDNGKRLAINKKYSYIWSAKPISRSGNRCITNNEFAEYNNKEYYKPVCEKYTCVTRVVK